MRADWFVTNSVRPHYVKCTYVSVCTPNIPMTSSACRVRKMSQWCSALWDNHAEIYAWMQARAGVCLFLDLVDFYFFFCVPFLCSSHFLPSVPIFSLFFFNHSLIFFFSSKPLTTCFWWLSSFTNCLLCLCQSLRGEQSICNGVGKFCRFSSYRIFFGLVEKWAMYRLLCKGTSIFKSVNLYRFTGFVCTMKLPVAADQVFLFRKSIYICPLPFVQWRQNVQKLDWNLLGRSKKQMLFGSLVPCA